MSVHSPDDFIKTTCTYGNCLIFLNKETKIIEFGMGSVSCPCDNTRGWNAQRLASMGKPHPPIKPSKGGRYKGKSDRRRREQAEWNEWFSLITRYRY